jgi:hypothetical protein
MRSNIRQNLLGTESMLCPLHELDLMLFWLTIVIDPIHLVPHRPTFGLALWIRGNESVEHLVRANWCSSVISIWKQNHPVCLSFEDQE